MGVVRGIAKGAVPGIVMGVVIGVDTGVATGGVPVVVKGAVTGFFTGVVKSFVTGVAAGVGMDYGCCCCSCVKVEPVVRFCSLSPSLWTGKLFYINQFVDLRKNFTNGMCLMKL